MAPPEIKIGLGLGLSFGKTGDIVPSTAGKTPAPYKGTPFEMDIQKNYPVVAPEKDYSKLHLEGEIRGILDYAEICKSDLCKRVDAGVQIGVGDWSLSALAQYRHPAGPVSFIARGTVGAEWYSGNATSRSEMGPVHLSPTAAFAATASVGIEYTIANQFPVQVFLSSHYNSPTDMGHGFKLDDGFGGMLTVIGGWKAFSGATSSSSETSSKARDAACKDAADELQLGPDALKSAVEKCKDSALPVFQAMVNRLQAFKVVAGESSSLKEYRASLKQLTDAIAPAVVAAKLTPSEGLMMLKELAKLYQPVLNEMKKTPDLAYLQEAERALDYPYMELLRLEDPVDSQIKAEADELLKDILTAASDAPEHLPEVLKGLVKIDDGMLKSNGARSAWLKTHKAELMAAAQKIEDKADKKEIIALLKATFK